MKRARTPPDTQPGEFTEAELHSSIIDQHKAQLDVLKHISTLDTAILLVVVAFVEKVFVAPRMQWMIGFAVLCLLSSLAASGLACLSVLAAFPRYGATRMDKTDRRERSRVMIVTFLGLFFGVVFLAGFFFYNWFL
ncbi:hypothetical protein [Rhizobacter fulvus]